MKRPIIQTIEDILHNKDIDDNSRLIEIQRLISEQHAAAIYIEDSKSLMELYKETIQSIKNTDQISNLISTGFKNLDLLIAGFELGELIIFGGRPSMGKTTLLLNLAVQISKKQPVLFFSYDLSESALTTRIICNLTSCPSDKIAQHTLTDNDLLNLLNIEESLNEFQLFINDSCSNSIIDFRIQCEKMITEKGIKVVFIDYLQMMSSNKYGNRRELEISYISRELKRIAKELNICVIASSQLSRAVEMRGGDRQPILSDLRESGVIEQVADKVFFIYRPEYYGFTHDEDGNSNANKMYLILAKNRTGPEGTAFLRCDLSRSSISDIEEGTMPLDGSNDRFNFSSKRLDEIDEDPF